MFNGAMQHSQCNMISRESFFPPFYFTALFLIVKFKSMFKSWANKVYTVSKLVLTSLWAKLIDDNDNDIFLIQLFKLL